MSGEKGKINGSPLTFFSLESGGCLTKFILFFLAMFYLIIVTSSDRKATQLLPTWGDETFSVRLSLEPWNEFWIEILNDVHPPLYFVISKLFASTFKFLLFQNECAASTDFLFVLSLCFCTVILYNILQKLVDNKLLLLSLFFIIFSAHLTLFGLMMRYYLLSAVFVFYSSAILLGSTQYKKELNIHQSQLMYGIFLYLGLATSYLTAVVIPAHLIYILKRPPSESKPLLKSLMWVCIASIPLILLFIYQIGSLESSFILGPIQFIKGFLARFLFTIYSFSVGEFIRPWDFWLSIPAVIAVCYLLFIALRFRHTPYGSFLWLMLLVSLPLGVIAVTIIGIGIEFSPARLFFLAPIFLLLIGFALVAPGNSKLEIKISTAAIIVLIIINLISTINYVTGRSFIQSTYIIPWKKISHDISERHPQAYATMLLYDDDTLSYWLESDVVPGYRANLLTFDASQTEVPLDNIKRVILVYSPRIISDEQTNNLLEEWFNPSMKLIEEIIYLREDENSMRWKSMLLGRQVYEVKKKLIVYNVAGEPSETQ